MSRRVSSHGMVNMSHIYIVSIHTAPHLAKSRPISHLVNIDPTRHIRRSQKTHLNVVKASPKGSSYALLLKDITSIAAAKHMHKDLLMQVCIEQIVSGDCKASG